MVSTTPPSPGSPNVPLFPYNPAIEDALDAARQAQHIANPTLPLIGFTNGLPGFGNTCFRSALISLLINLPPLSGWIVSDTQGQLDSSPAAHLLENVVREYFATNLTGKQIRADRAIQRWYRYFNINKPVDLKKIRTRYPQNTQQDAAEVLLYLTSDIKAELIASGNLDAERTFRALVETSMVAEVECSRCKRGTHRTVYDDEKDETTLRVSLTSNTTSFRDLLRGAFAETATPAPCRRCNAVAPRTAKWKILTSPEVLLVDVDQSDPLKSVSVKPGLQVPTIPEELDLGEYFHDVAATTARYRLAGVVNHRGVNPNKGHYVSHVRHPSGSWFLLDDSTVYPSSVALLQAYKPSLKANQMIPRLIAYLKIRDDEDVNAIATRAAYPQPRSRAFQQPQIVYDEWMKLDELKALCKKHSLVPGNAKTVESMRKIIDTANSADSSFTTRLKDWVTTTLLSTGTTVDINSKTTKIQLAAQLKAFMMTQPARKPAPKKTTGPGKSPDPKAGDKAGVTGEGPPPGGEAEPPAGGENDTVTQAALDTANARIAQLEQTIADLQRNLPITGSRPSSRSDTGGRSPRTVTTDQIRELIQRLPASPSSPRGRKRQASDAADGSPKTQKRRAIQLAAQACAAIDAGGQLAPADSRRSSDAENQGPSRSRSGSRHSGSPHAAFHVRCHRCPIIAGEIHHMHATVCGWVPGGQVSPPTQSEIEDDTKRIERLGETDEEEEEEEEEEDPDILLQGVPHPENGGLPLLLDGDRTQIFLDDSTRKIDDSSTARKFINDPTGEVEDGGTTRNFLSNNGEQRQRSSRSYSIPSDGSRTRSFLAGRGVGASPRPETKTKQMSPGTEQRAIQDLLQKLAASGP